MNKWTERGLLTALRHYVRRCRLSDYRVAQMMGVSVNSLQEWLKSGKQPRLRTQIEIRKFLQQHDSAGPPRNEKSQRPPD